MAGTSAAGWRWDPSLYEGSAAHYTRGRVPYPPKLIALIIDELDLDGHGRLLDVGCGPGSLTVPLATHVEQAVGVDPDEQMLVEASHQATAAGVTNIEWVHRRGEDLSLDLGRFQVVTMAQSFHWMDRGQVAGLLHQLLTRDGAVVYVHATTHQGVDGTARLPYPRPPREEIDALVATFLGQERRAGRGFRHLGPVTEDERSQIEAGMFTEAGFVGPVRRTVPGWLVTRVTDEVMASVFSLSYAAPHLFGDRRETFEQEVRGLLNHVSPTGLFSEQMREIAVEIWRA